VRVGSIEDLLRGVLDRGYEGVATRVLRAVSSSVQSGRVQADLDALDAEARRLHEAGERLRVDNASVRAVLSSLDLAMRDNVVRLRDAGGELQLVGVEAAQSLTRQLALPGLNDDQVRAIGVEWVQPDAETLARLVELVDSPAFGEALSSLSANVVDTVANQAIRGVALGWSPIRIAREIGRITQSYPQAVASTMMRTLQLESYRSATAASQNANRSIIRRVIRIETLDNRICLACIALHGTVIWDAERDADRPIPRIREHENGRGTTVTETVIRPLVVETGVDWWARQDEARRRSLASGAAYRALDAGAVTLDDFVGERTDDLFGEMIFEQSVVGILGEGAERFYQR